MKIGIVGTVVGSVLHFRLPLIKKLVENSHEVYVFAIDFNLENKLILEKLGVIPVDYNLSRSGLNPICDIKSLFFLFQKFKEIRLDIVFSYFVKPTIYATLAARFANIPIRVAMLEGLGFAFTLQPDGIPFKTRLIKKVQVILYKIALPSATTVIFLNSDDRDELIVNQKVKVKSVEVLGGIGIDLEDFPYQKPITNNISFLFIGRLFKEKGIYEYLEAAVYVKKLNPEVKIIIIGEVDTTSPNSLDKLFLNKHIESGCIDYVGHVSNVYEWLSKSTVFVLPSYREGVPRSTQEALAVGRPVITTDVPGCRETVIDGENGFLIPPFHSQAIADKMLWFIKNSSEIEKMGIASRKIAETKFNVNTINEKLFTIMGIDQ